MSDLPAPLVPADVDLRDFPYMPLDVARLRDSDLAAVVSAEAFRAAVILWCAAWHQTPAASLPGDDLALARLAGFGRDLVGWKKAREGALRGFVPCSDGRLYHPVIAEKALNAWEAKQAQRARTAAATAARLAKKNGPRDEQRGDDRNEARDEQRHDQRNVRRDEPRNEPREKDVTSTKGEREGERNFRSSLRSDSPKRVRTRHDYSQDFLEFWAAYPTDANMGKRETFDEWVRLGEDERRQAIASCPSFVRHCKADPTYRPIHANRYLAKRRFEGHAEANATSRSIDFGGGAVWLEANVRVAVSRWRVDASTWPTDRIGPPPGSPGCRVPSAILLEAA